MSESEKTSFCEWADFQASCTATVSQGEACVSAIAAMPCMSATDACNAIFACIPQ